MEKRKKDMKRYKNLAGYRLHLKRFMFSNKQGIRTIKLPLGEWDASTQQMKPLNGVAQEFANWIKSDYEGMYGPLNLPTYKAIKEEKKDPIYSLRDFWVDCLRVGVIMKHTGAKLLDDVRVMDGSQEEIDEKQKKRMKKADPEFYEAIDFEKFKEGVLKQKEFRKVKKNIDIFNDRDGSYAKRKIEEIFKEIVGVERSREKYEKYWERYGADFSLYWPDKTAETTFFLVPGIDNRGKELEVVELIELIEHALKDKLGEKYTKVGEYIGLSDSFCGFSQAFNVKGKKAKDEKMLKMLEDYKEFLNVSPELWKGKEDELRDKVAFLLGRVKQLNDPYLVNGWHDYRADIGGSLTSWLSNSFGQDERIKLLLHGNSGHAENGKKEQEGAKKPAGSHVSNLKSLGDELETLRKDYQGSDGESIEEEIREIQSIAERMGNVLDTIPKLTTESRISVADLENYRELLTQIRLKLTYLYQEVYGEDGEGNEEGKKSSNKKPSAKKIFSKLFENLPKIPSFIGDVKIKRGGVYDKYLDSLNRLKDGFEFFITSQEKEREYGFSPQGKLDGESDEAKERQVERIKGAFQGLLRIYRAADSSTIASQIIEKTLKHFYNGDLKILKSGKNDHQYDYFFRNERSREKRGEELKLTESLIPKRDLPKILRDTKIDWGKYGLIDHWKNGETFNEWIGLLEIEKVRTGLLAAFYDISPIKKELDALKERGHFPNIEVVFNRFKDEDKKKPESIGTVIQQAVLSEMKGTVSKMSTTDLIARYVVQPQDVEKSVPLATDIPEYGSKRKKGMGYYVNIQKLFKEEGGVDSSKEEKYQMVDKKDPSKGLKRTELHKEHLLQIQSSTFQTQFLDNIFSGRWEEVSPIISSYSFIYEEYYKISWGNDGVCISLDKEKVPRLFVSIPFKLGFEHNKERNEKLAQRENFLGIDIGEYGVALYLLDTKNFDTSIYTQFFYDPTLRKIRGSVKENKKRQRSGTFSVPNTYTKRLRDQAITRLRNKVHSVVVQNEAWPVYEKEVSAFESGSGKISKIYHSLKQSDVFSENSAGYMERGLVWGKGKRKDSKPIGRDVGAYATSYMCSHCNESIYKYISNDDSNYDPPKKKVKEEGIELYSVKEVENGRTVIFDVEGVDVCGYIEGKDQIKKGDKKTGKEVVNAVKKYARAPIKSILQRCKEFKKEFDTVLPGNKEDEKVEIFEKVCGTQAVYTCPFCRKVSDADVQAALWVALRGYLNMLASGDKNDYWGKKQGGDFDRGKWEKGSGKEKIQYLLDFAKKKEIPPVPFSFSARPDICKEIKKERKKKSGKKK